MRKLFNNFKFCSRQSTHIKNPTQYCFIQKFAWESQISVKVDVQSTEFRRQRDNGISKFISLCENFLHSNSRCCFHQISLKSPDSADAEEKGMQNHLLQSKSSWYQESWFIGLLEIIWAFTLLIIKLNMKIDTCWEKILFTLLEYSKLDV